MWLYRDLLHHYGYEYGAQFQAWATADRQRWCGTSFPRLQALDGPAPEALCSRLVRIGVDGGLVSLSAAGQVDVGVPQLVLGVGANLHRTQERGELVEEGCISGDHGASTCLS